MKNSIPTLSKAKELKLLPMVRCYRSEGRLSAALRLSLFSKDDVTSGKLKSNFASELFRVDPAELKERLHPKRLSLVAIALHVLLPAALFGWLSFVGLIPLGEIIHWVTGASGIALNLPAHVLFGIGVGVAWTMLFGLIRRNNGYCETKWDEVSKATLRPGNYVSKCAKLVLHKGRRKHVAYVNHEDTEHLAGFLHNRLEDRFHLSRFPGMDAILTFMLLLTGLPLLGLGVLLLTVNSSFDLLPLASVLSAIFAVILFAQILAWIPKMYPWLRPEPKTKKATKDRSGREPFRSRPVGWTLKIIAVVSIAFIFLAAGGGVIGWLLAVIPLMLLYFGNLLTQVKPSLVRANDTRSPILYLRSFFDDRATTLMPFSRPAIAAGVQPPRYLPRPWNYILLLNPVRIFRVFMGWGSDTSEEQLSLFFRQYGPFVAIGKPGETFASPGASRMYVTNDEWQQVVLDHLESSQMIVLQPAKTEGVWWEVEKTLSKVDLRRVLFCMVNFHNRQDDYENFRIRANEFLEQPLPDSVSYSRTPTFIYFDDQGRSYVQEVSCRFPGFWPILGEAVDLNYTLHPFLNSVLELNASVVKSLTHESQNEELQVTDQVGANAPRTAPVWKPREPRGISRSAVFGGLGAFSVLNLMLFLLVLPVISAIGNARDGGVAEESIPERHEVLKPAISLTGTANVPAVGENQPAVELSPEVSPQDFDGWMTRVLTQQAAGNLQGAFDALEKASELKPGDVAIFVKRGELLSIDNQWEQAEAEYKLSLIHISSPRDQRGSRMPSSA